MSVLAALDCADAELRGRLERDFSGFPGGPVPGGLGPALSLRLGRCPFTPLARADWAWRGCRVSDDGPRRRLDYGAGSGAEWDFSRESGTLWSPDRALLHELGYLFLHSRLGARLDGRGLHRVHALGFAWRGAGVLVLLPEGGGKTTLALHLARRPAFALLSDDIPLLDARSGELLGFPQRLSLRGPAPFAVAPEALRPFPRRRHGTKTLLDQDAFPGAWARRAPLAGVIVGARSAGAPRLGPCPRWRAAAALIDALVVGRGTPQVLELMAPAPPYAPGALSLAAVARSRLGAARRAWRTARLARFLLGDDPAAAAEALVNFLDESA